MTEIPDGLLPERPAPAIQPTDSTLAEYNAYLTELAEKDTAAQNDSLAQNDKKDNPMTETPKPSRSSRSRRSAPPSMATGCWRGPPASG